MPQDQRAGNMTITPNSPQWNEVRDVYNYFYQNIVPHIDDKNLVQTFVQRLDSLCKGLGITNLQDFHEGAGITGGQRKVA